MLVAALDALNKGIDVVAALDTAAMPIADQLKLLDVLETAQRRLNARSHRVINELTTADPALVVHKAVADTTRISMAEARRRIRDAQQLAPRSTLTGEPLPPALPTTANAWHAGTLDGQHLRVIQKFFKDLPAHIAPDVVARSETFLAEHAKNLRPDQLEKLALQLAVRVNPDGKFSDDDRVRQRGFTWCGPQRADGMSVGKLVASPQLRAELDAWFAKFAAPGMCNPADETPTISGEPATEVADRDQRGHGQRQHDALSALLRGQLGDPKLGTHNGLPVTIIATATVQDLHAHTGQAITAAGTRLPITDLIRMASHAVHYLSLFDNTTGRALWLGRTKRIATADQRIVLHAKDRGCTHPGCDMPGYLSEVHHVQEWATGGPTNIDNLTFACSPHHKLLGPSPETGWQTKKLATGQTQWIPPPQLGLPSGTNDSHHPERLLVDEDKADP